MRNMTLEKIAQALGGRLYGAEGSDLSDREVQGVVIDNRQVEKDYLFIPIRGARVDGHSFIGDAFAKGVLGVLSDHVLEDAAGPYIVVKDTEQALKDLAAYYREQIDAYVIGIIGSVGKTSTKEMVASVLGQRFSVLKTQGNFNNEIGLPLTLFCIRPSHQVAVVEMGISDFGEMDRLGAMARPDMVIMTNIGQCHLENLKTRDGILQAKTEIFDHLRENGHIIINGDDDKLSTVGTVHGIKPVHFGLDEKNEYYADEIESQGFRGISCRIHTPQGSFSALILIPGRHMVYNALAGTAVGCTYGLTLEQIKQGIETLQSVSGRFHIIETGKYTVVDDCYNANPVSMKASLDVLKEAKGRKVAVLGDMGELGTDEAALHAEVGTHAGTCGIDALYCAGPLCEHLAKAAKEADSKLEVRHFADRESLMAELPKLLQDGDQILVKASHFMEYGKIVEMLETAQKL